ncbi:putative thiamine-triphosphatase [Ixodes scapularis]
MYSRSQAMACRNLSRGHREVERKFRAPCDIEDRLVRIGAVLGSRTQFTDRYYDTQDNVLALNDHWLRIRGGASDHWELKYRKHNDTPSNDSAVTIYNEETGEANILTIVKKLLPERSPVGEAVTLKDFVSEGLLREFACIQTWRSSYKTSGRSVVDLDQTDWGYRVAEIEVLLQEADCDAQGKDAMEKATEEISRLAAQLDGKPLFINPKHAAARTRSGAVRDTHPVPANGFPWTGSIHDLVDTCAIDPQR